MTERQFRPIVRHQTPDVLRIAGADWLDFLNRIATANFLDLAEDSARPSLLTNALGRLVDLIWVVRQTDAGFLLTSPDQGTGVLEWLKQYIFFQDDVQLAPLDRDVQLLGAYGSASVQALCDHLGLSAPEGESTTSDGHWLAWRVHKPTTGMLAFSMETDGADPLAELPIPASAPGEFERLRLRQGWADPRLLANHGANPLEAGLGDWISFDKGCYIGQEVIARLDSRGRVARRLCLLEFRAQPPQTGRLFHQGRLVGELLEATPDVDEMWLGLGLVKTQALTEEPMTLTCEPANGGDEESSVTAIATPFHRND